MPLLNNAALLPLEERITRFQELIDKLRPVPEEWLEGAKDDPVGASLSPIPCQSYREVVDAWKQVLEWSEGLDCALSMMLASVLTTNLTGESIWTVCTGPPSSGKTTLLEGVSVNKQYILSKDTIRGFYSGWRSGDGMDNSLLAKCYGKTLAMKEGDAFVKAPNVQQILSEGRGIYDGVGRSDFRNMMGRDYEGVEMTWIICGTGAIRYEIDRSELGARFLSCSIADNVDWELERSIILRAIDQEEIAMEIEADGSAQSHYTPGLMRAMQLTGGYVGHLREIAREAVTEVKLSREEKRYCGDLGLFVTFMRARSGSDDVEPEREFGYRLAKQFYRLARAFCVVTNQPYGEDIHWRVKKVAMDTARGLNLDITRKLYAAGREGVSNTVLAAETNRQSAQIGRSVRFLRHLGAVNTVDVSVNGRNGVQRRHVLTPRLRELCGRLR